MYSYMYFRNLVGLKSPKKEKKIVERERERQRERERDRERVAGSTPAEVGNISFVEIDHEIFSTVLLSLPLIQEGQLSVSGERMCTILVNCLED